MLSSVLVLASFRLLICLLEVKFIKSHDLSQSLQKYNARKYEPKHVCNQDWLLTAGFRPAAKSSRQTYGCGIHESFRPVHRILQRFGLDLEETGCIPSTEILCCYGKQRRLVHLNTARRANWIVDRTVVFHCGDSRRETRMAKSFNRLWSGRRKTGNENEKKAKKCTQDASYSGEFLWGAERNRAEKIKFNSSMKDIFWGTWRNWQSLFELEAMKVKIRGWTTPSWSKELSTSI